LLPDGGEDEDEAWAKRASPRAFRVALTAIATLGSWIKAGILGRYMDVGGTGVK
jgi:hypothetical protein